MKRKKILKTEKKSTSPSKKNENGDAFSIIPPLSEVEIRKRRREKIAIGVISLIVLVFSAFLFRSTSISETLPLGTSLLFIMVLDLNVILLLALVFLIIKRYLRVMTERRQNVLGSRLKSRLITSFLAIAIVPAGVLFMISSAYINQSFDKWFSLKVQNTLKLSLDITNTYYRNTERTGLHFANHISGGLGRRFATVTESVPDWVQLYLESQRELLALDSVEFYHDEIDERVIARSSDQTNYPAVYPRLPLDRLSEAFEGNSISQTHSIGTGDLIRSLVPVRLGNRRNGEIVGVVAVNTYVPVSLVDKVGAITSVYDDYIATNPLQYRIKDIFFMVLIAVTLVIVFAAIWAGMNLAREYTDPVERLIQGAHAVGAGNLDISVIGGGHDEISELVETFNKMTVDLKTNQRELKRTSEDLEKRRTQLEAVLENIETGVLAVGLDGSITTFNRAASNLLGLTENDAIGINFRRVLTGELSPLSNLISKALPLRHKEKSLSPLSIQWTSRINGEPKNYASIATPLTETAEWGVVVVIEDMTHIVQGQREMAWREVARRIAHEIKNPLTPIKLSAQRLQRRLDKINNEQAGIFKECTDIIIQQTDDMTKMVNEFSQFARFPEINPSPEDLNDAISEMTHLYRQAHPDVIVQFQPDETVPEFSFDKDQIKRVLINLMNNAVSALKAGSAKHKKVKITVRYEPSHRIARIEVKDNGPGMTLDVKSKIFEPYFSTKKDGNGLGLAIAKRIVNDHDGVIRVQSQPGQGTTFSIELPTAMRQIQTEPRRSDESQEPTL